MQYYQFSYRVTLYNLIQVLLSLEYTYRQILKVNRFDSGICHANIGSINLDNVYGEEKCIMEI